MPEQTLLTARQSAELLNMTPANFQKNVERDPALKAIRIMITSRLYLYEKDDVIDWYKNRTVRRRRKVKRK